ncbi:MAG: ATPase, T2SS/T4P/T4SS family [Polyangiales bacterium]
MFSIVITEKGGAQHALDLDAAEIGIGRLEDNAICLPKNNVSKHHARLVLKDNRFVIVDQKSTNGTYVNGRRITGPTVVRRGDKIYIGDFILTLGVPAGAAVAAREFSPLPPAPPSAPAPTLEVKTVPTQTGGLSAELKRTQPERRSAHDRPPTPDRNVTVGQQTAAERSIALGTEAERRAAQNGPPPLPKSQLPPPLPRSPTVPSMPPVTEHTQADGPLIAAAPTTPPDDIDDLGDFEDDMPEPIAPGPLPPSYQPASDAAEGVDSAQGAALSGLTSPAALAPSVRLQGALSLLMERLATHMNVARDEVSAFPQDQQTTLERLLDQLEDEGTLGPDVDRRFVREAAVSEAVGLGPLDRLLANRSVREVVVDGPTRVLADLGGGLTPVSSFFSDDSAVRVLARRLMHRAGQRLDESQMIHEAQLPGGGAVQVLLPPLSPKGPLISVRSPMRAQSSPESFIADRILSAEMLALLRASLEQRRNVLVIGPRGGGVSHMLAMLTRLAPEHERIVSIEHSPSASLLNPQVLPLSRRALPDASLSELLRRAALLRYDRLVLDDLCPEETWSALFVAAGGSGVLLGMHAPTPAVALSLLEHGARTAQRASEPVPGPLMAAALQLLVHVGPDATGARKVQSISEVRVSSSAEIELRTLFRHDGKTFVASFLGR